MIYRKDNNNIFVRLVRGENIFNKLYELIEKERIKSGWINGIGAIENIQIGSYDLVDKKYNKIVLNGVYELTSLMGNISYKEKKPFLHIHVNLSNHDCKSYGGHLFSAKINATGEFIIHITDINIDREYDDEIGLHLIEFANCEK